MRKSLKLTSHVQLLFKGIAILCIVVSYQSLHSQSTTAGLGNTPGVPGIDFLGWGPSVDSDVFIRHRTEGQPIIFSTNGFDRMGITADERILINTPNAFSAKMSVANTRGKGAVIARVSNSDGNSLNGALRVFLTDSNRV